MSKLTKESIQQLGWLNTGQVKVGIWQTPHDQYIIKHSDSKQDVMDGYESKWIMLLPAWGNFGTYNTVPNINIQLQQYGGFAGESTDEQVFKGTCEDIEELKQLMKMLRIKTGDMNDNGNS